MSLINKLLSLKGWYKIKEDVFESLGMRKKFLWLYKHTPIRPDHITYLNFLVGLYSVWVLFESLPLFALAIVGQLVLDNLDGYYARVIKLNHGWGRYLDHGVDFVVGVLILIKSYFVFGHWWILLALTMFCFEGGLLYLYGLTFEKFPSRMFMYLFIFGMYIEGLWLQLFGQPLSFVIYWWGRGYRKRRGDI